MICSSWNSIFPYLTIVNTHTPYSMVRRLCELRSSFLSRHRGEKKYEQWAKCLLVLYAKPSNKRCTIPLQKKNCYFAIGLYFFGKSIKKHPDSFCENDNNNEVNVCAYYIRVSNGMVAQKNRKIGNSGLRK